MSEVTGKIIHIGETLTVGNSGTFKKRQLVVETDEQYKQQIPIDFVQDKTSILDQYQVGNNVVVGINIRGNEYNGKWYCSLNGWKINKQDTSQQSPEPQSAVDNYETKTSPQQFASAKTTNEEEPDDMPF
jgi:hypothetical protein